MKTKKIPWVSEYVSSLLILKIQNIQILFFLFKVIVSGGTQPEAAEFHDEVSFFPVSFASILWAVGNASLASGGQDSLLHTFQPHNMQQTAHVKLAVLVRRWLCQCVGGCGSFWFLFPGAKLCHFCWRNIGQEKKFLYVSSTYNLTTSPLSLPECPFPKEKGRLQSK